MNAIKVYFYLCIIINITFSQEEITVYVDIKETNVTKFEKQLIINIFKLKERKENIKINLNFVAMNTFGDVFSFMDANANNSLKNTSLAINEISFTKERAANYELSEAYMFNKYTVMTLNDREDLKANTDFMANLTYGAVENSIFHDRLQAFAVSHLIRFKTYDNAQDIYIALQQNKIDYIYSDYVDGWGFGLDPVFFDGDYLDQFSIMFPKGSTLVNEMNIYIKYFKQSPQFYQLIKNYFGSEAVLFFKKSLRTK